MTPEAALDYCRQRIAVPGTAPYYAARFAARGDEPAVLGLLTLADELQGLAWSRETEVATVRLQWWREEMQRLWNGSPRHPISRCLAQSATAPDPAPLAACLDAVATALATEDGILPGSPGRHYHRAMWSELMVSLCRVTGYGATASDGFARRLGEGRGATELLTNIGALVHRRASLLPPSLRPLAGDDQELAQRVREEAEAANRAFAAARDELPRAGRRSQLPALVLASIDEATLGVLDPRRVLLVRTRLTPLRCAWVALRTHRQVHLQETRS